MFIFFPWQFLFVMVNFLGVVISVSSTHNLSVWLGMEIGMIGCMPLLIANYSVESSESAIKYFLVQSVGSGVVLVGCAMEPIKSFLSVSIFFLFLGLSLKLALFPFYMWFPSVMGGLSWSGCFLVACVNKIAPFVFMVDISELIYGSLILFNVVGAVLGSIGGLNQLQLRSLMGYSSVNHFSWMMCVLCFSKFASYLYLLFYSLIISMIFFLFSVNSLYSYVLLKTKFLSKLLLVVSSVGILSLLGFPPFTGFVLKLVAYSVLYVNFGVLLFLILSSLISAVYYMYMIFLMCISYSSVKGKGFSYYNDKTDFVFYVQCFVLVFNLFGPLFYSLILFLL